MSAAAGEEFIQHFGVKGMKWGVRKNREATAATAEARVNAGIKGHTKIKAKGGVAQDAHPDAVKVATKKQIMRKSGTAALSNQDLNDLAQRMRLELEVKRLDAESASAGKKFIKKALGQNTQRVAQQEIASNVDKGVRAVKIKRAAKVAAAVA